MARPRILDQTLLEKIAEKKGLGRFEIDKVAKSVGAKARRLKVCSPVALVIMAEEFVIGTANFKNTFDREKKEELRHYYYNQGPSPKPVTHKRTRRHGPRKRKIIEFVKYETSDYFIKGHFNEINKAYSNGCYTSVFILARKIVENLIVDILQKKYPEKKRENRELYFDTHQKRTKDFSVILKNLYEKRNDFGTENKAIEKLYNMARKLKDDANDKTHCWYHLVEKKIEIDNLNLPALIELIKKIEKVVGIRSIS